MTNREICERVENMLSTQTFVDWHESRYVDFISESPQYSGITKESILQEISLMLWGKKLPQETPC
jgi:hypothetical protein